MNSLGFLMRSMRAAKTTVLFELQLLRGRLFVFSGGIVSLLALGAGKSDDISHCNLPLYTSCGGEITPTPTNFIR